MSDDDIPGTTPKPPKRAPRRRTTPAKAAAVPKRTPAKTVEMADAQSEAAAAIAPPKAPPARPRRRRATAAVAPSVAPSPVAEVKKPGRKPAAAKPKQVPAPVEEAAKPKRVRAKRVAKSAPPVVPVEQEFAPEPVSPATASLAVDPVVEPAPVQEVDDDTLGLALGESPVDLPGSARVETGGVGWASAILAIASPLLLLFNSHAIDNWARQLPVNSWSGPVIDAATRWHETMQRIGFAAPVDAGRAGWKRVKGEE